MSLLVSFTLVPWMTSKWAVLAVPKHKMIAKVFNIFETGINKVNRWVLGWMHWSLKNKTITLTGATIIFFSSFILFPAGYIGAEFASSGDRGVFVIRLEFPHDISLQENNNKTRIVEDYLRSQPEVNMVLYYDRKKIRIDKLISDALLH